MTKKLFAIIMVCALALLAACGSIPQTSGNPAAENTQQPAEAEQETEQKAETPAEETPAEEAASEDGQNPVMNFVGVYSASRANMLVEAEGAENAKITVTWAGSAWEQAKWVMSGSFDADTLTVAYSNGTLTELTYKSNGEVDTETVTYEDGTGRIIFHPEDNTITWEDDKAHVADGLVFEFSPAADALEVGDPDYYTSVTAMDKRTVEEACFFVRDAYLNENWAALADTIRYPITINETELKDADEFLAYMNDKTLHESDRSVMLDENCHDMFVNGEGICMGSGQIWLLDPNYMTDEEPQLQIIAISGIVNK